MSQSITSSRGQEIQKHVVGPALISLDGAGIREILFVADGSWAVDKIKIVYQTAASISGLSYGVNVLFGNLSDAAKFGAWSSLTSATDGQIVNLTLNRHNLALSNDEAFYVRTFGPLANAGVIAVFIYFSRMR